MPRIVVLEGKATPSELSLEGEVRIGRAKDADLQLFDETASRKHARIVEAEGRTWLEDEGSANGVYLNEERVEGRAVLFHGDEIRIGKVRFQVVTDEGVERRTVVREALDTRVEAAVDPDRVDPAQDAGSEGTEQRMRLLCDGAAASADATDERGVVEAFLDLAADALGAERASVSILGAGGVLRLVAARPKDASAPDSTTLRRRVLEDGEAVLIRDAYEDAVRLEAASMVASRFRSTLAAPLKTAEGVLGQVVLEAESAGRWGEEDLRALAAAARQTALSIRNLRQLGTARAELRRLSHGLSDAAHPILGEDPSMKALRQKIGKAAGVETPILVTGETGTGKELVARSLHAESPRGREPFVALNCAALVEGLLESEMFGHEKGAFTGATDTREGRIEQAGKGTLFLDEVGDLSPALQAKLLRVLSEGVYTRVGGKKTLEVRCRVVAATHRDLKAMVEEGTFRQDLYYRLAVLEIQLPPLRARGSDVILLAEAGLERLAAKLGRRVPRLEADAREALGGYAWPGNVRELMNVLERALVLLEGEAVTAADLPAEIRAPGRTPAPTADASEVLTFREAELRALKAALRASGGKKGRAVEILGTSWPTLNRKIRQYGLEP